MNRKDIIEQTPSTIDRHREPHHAEYTFVNRNKIGHVQRRTLNRAPTTIQNQPSMQYRITVRRPRNKRCDSSGTTTASNSPESVLTSGTAGVFWGDFSIRRTSVSLSSSLRAFVYGSDADDGPGPAGIVRGRSCAISSSEHVNRMIIPPLSIANASPGLSSRSSTPTTNENASRSPKRCTQGTLQVRNNARHFFAHHL
jgi:hypothetical protein